MRIKKIWTNRLVNVHISKHAFLLLLALSVFSTGQAQTWSLQQCIDTAQVNNKNLQMSRNKMEIGREKQSEAKANLIPKISLNADYKYFAGLPYQLMPQSAFGGPEGMYKEVQMGVPHNMGANIQLAMPVYNPQVYGGIEATKIASELNGLQYKKTEEQVFFEISNLYYNAQILTHQKAFIDSNLLNTGKLLENLKLLHGQQMIKKSDVSKVELQKEQLNTQRQLVVNNFEQVMNALKFSMGIPIQQEIQIETAVKNKEEVDYPNSLPVDLQIALTQNKLLSSELSTLKDSRLPTISLFGSYGQTGFGYDEKPNDFLNFYPSAFAGLQLSVPLFNGTVTKRKINQKNLEIANNQLQIDLVKDQNQMLIENAKRLRLVNRQTIENTQNQIELANTVYSEMVLQQKEGTATLTDILLADNAVREAQTSNLSAIIEYLKADLELKKLSGNMSLKN
ncbi:TolC family protein [uncultured Draconibacterium sp.]|uniref:TolC family protein n=1 Tax=uncultured Draconibacterium sp. TaxID=1573823 RepID=UPI003217BF42